MSTLGEYRRCTICSEYRWTGHNHRCSPAWECVDQDSLADADKYDLWETVYARNAEEAAEKYSHLKNQFDAEYPPERTVIIRHNGNMETFIVELHYEPVYSASKTEDA